MKTLNRAGVESDVVAFLVCLVLTVLAGGSTLWSQTAATYPGQIGVEVADRPTGFIDAFKDQGRLFLDSSGNPVATDANGNPLSDGLAVIFDNRPVPAWTGIIDDPDQYQPDCSGVYTIVFQGQATLSNVSGAPTLTFANQTYNAATNTTTVNVTMPGGPTYADGPALMEISFTNTQRTATSGTNTGITGLQAIRPGFSASTTQAFDPAFLTSLSPFGYLRFMGWLGTNTNPGYYGDTGHHLLNWSTRSLPADFYQGIGTNTSTNSNINPGAWGISWEYVILLANATNKDIWINIPISATGSSDPLDPTYVAPDSNTGYDDTSYIYNLAYLLKNGDAFTGNVGLNPGLHVYIEHSNEVWNSGFLQYTWNLLAAEDEVNAGGSVLNNDGDTSQYDWAYRRHIKRLYEIGQIFQSVFGPGSLNTTIRPVYAWWQLDEGSGSNAANALAWFKNTYGPPSNYFYGMAQGDYFNAPNYASDTTIPEVLSDMQASSNASVSYVTENLATAQQYGLPLFAYEGGPASDNGGTQDTTNVGIQILANRDSGMNTLVQDHIANNWFAKGASLFGYFGLSSAYSRYGDWGATDDYRNLTTAKYNALVNLLGYTNGGVPVAPGNLVANGGNQQVLLSWEPVPGAANYKVLRGTASGGETLLATISSSTYSDTAVSNGVTYYYEVTAVNSSGASGPSNEASATPESTPPPAPVLTATASNGQITLSWSASAGATAYNVYQGSASGGESTTPIATGVTLTSYTVTGLTNGTTYYFEVAGVNTIGTGTFSNEASVSPIGPPPAPTGLTATSCSGQAILSWAASSGATSYNVYEGVSPSAESSTPVATGITGTTYTVTGLINGMAYYFTVAAANSAGVSGYSNEAGATPAPPSPLLAYEPFGEASGSVLNGASGSGDSGWAAAWQVQNGSKNVPGYNITSTTPLTYAGLATSGNYGIGGDVYQGSGRALNVSAAGPFSAYLSSGLIDAPGQTIWISFLLRQDVKNAAPYVALTAQGGGQSWLPSPANIEVGYFGSASNNSSGNPLWSLQYNGTTLQTNVPVVTGQTTLFVIADTFGSNGQPDQISLYVDPTSLGGTAPATPTLQYSPANTTAFQSIAYYGGNTANQSSLDEIRVGTNFAAVTPSVVVVIPPPPTSLTVTAGSKLATLSWSPVSGATSYNIYEGTAAGGESTTPVATGITGSMYTVTGLTNGTAYYFTVAAVNTSGASAVSNEASATPSASLGVPAAPTGLTAAGGSNQVSLSWTAVSGATSYNIYEATASGAEGSTPIVTGVTASSYTATGLTNGTAYFFTVAAVNSYGTSATSSEASATPVTSVTGTNAPADFSIYPQILAANPVRAGFNMEPAAGTNIGENAWLADGGFSPYDARLSLTASQNGSDTTFIAENVGNDGGSDFWQSIATGYFVGATARTYRYAGGAWTLLRTDTVSGYTANGEDESAANNTITFSASGPPTQAGDIIWLDLDNQPFVPALTYLDPRFTTYCPNWSTEQLGCDTRTATVPYVLSTDVPASDAGGLSLELTDNNTETNGIWQYIQGAFVGPNDEEFQTGHTYKADVWLKQSGVANGNVTFSISGLNVSHTFSGVTSAWQEFTWTFPAPPGLQPNSVQPSVHLDFSAPGILWVDNFQLYDAAWAPNTVSPQVMSAWQDYQPGQVRIWSNFGVSSQGYGFFSLDSWLTAEIKTRNTPGLGNQYESAGQLEHLPDALANVKTLGANPWLIVNMALSEVEWGELIEYLAAPEGVGYAARRPADHPGPYTADFNTIYLEVGNEEWGTQVVPADTAYGQWANFVTSHATAGKSYFNSSQIKFIVNGFFQQPSFGSAAQAAAPQASFVDYALYSGGNSSLSGDAYYQSDLLQLPETNKPLIDAIVAQQQLDSAAGRVYGLAAYEEGPGSTTGDPSLAAAVGAIDVNLYASQSGFGPQNYFDYGVSQGGPWSSHTNFANGYRAQPVWEAYQMRNNYCTGPMVLATANSVPTSTDGTASPLVTVYAFQDANVPNQADVVVISRDLNNETPVTLHFPATPTGTANLYTLTGDPRASNTSAMDIPIGNSTVTVTPNYTFNMPPGSMYIFQVPMSGAWSATGIPTPPPPATLSANAGNSQVTLTWAISTGATSYNVLRGATSGGPYTQIASTPEITYTDTAVTNGTTYYYVVQAANAGGASANSEEVSATPNFEDAGYASAQPPLDGTAGGSWASTPFIPLTHYFSGTSTDTASYKTLWDSNYLYVLVSVQDSTLVPPTQANVFNGDTVELYFSGTDTRSTSYGPTDFQYAFPLAGNGAVVTEEDHNAVTGVILGQQTFASGITDPVTSIAYPNGGYQMTIALPWTAGALNTAPVAGQQYGFDVMIDDSVSQGDRIGKLGWWATQDSTWGNPSLMGALVLAAQQVAAPSNIAMTAASTAPPAGSADLLTATVTGSNGTPTGNVVFTAGGATLCTSALNGSGSANCNYTPTGSGPVTITAQYQGSSTYQTSSSTLALNVYDPAVSLQLASTQLVYSGATNVTACITPAGSATATGTVKIFDGATLLTTQSLQGGGCAYWYISPGLTAGAHPLTATYSGDSNNPAGTSAVTTATVSPVPVDLSVSCWNASFDYGANYQCTVNASSNAGSAQGNITYALDGGSAVSVPLNGGSAQFTISKPVAGTHQVVISYPQQTNYAVAGPQAESFSVSPAPVNVALTPSTYYTATGSTITFATAITSWSAGAPNATGSVSFYDGSTLLATVPVSSSGQASYSTAGLAAGTQTITATYAGGANYANGSSSATITLHQ